MITVGRISFIVVQLKHLNMKKLFHKIYWNQANFTGVAAGEIYVCLRKTNLLGNEELLPFLETPKLMSIFR